MATAFGCDLAVFSDPTSVLFHVRRLQSEQLDRNTSGLGDIFCRSRKGEESPSALDECREAARGRGDVREDEARMRPEKPVACKDIAVIIYGSRDVRKHCRKKDAAHNGEIHVVAVACLLTTMRMPEYSEPSAEASCRI